MEKYTSHWTDRHMSITAALAEHERLVHWVVHRQWLGTLTYAEAIQAGRIALWRAIERYDPSRGTKISTYAVPAIEREVWRAVAKAAPERQEVLTPHPPQEAPDLDEAVHSRLVEEELHRLVVRLPQRLAIVIIARYGLTGYPPQTFGAIGRCLGVTRQRVQQMHVEALLWLAHPGRSLQLRRLVDCNTVADYQAYLARLRRWQQKRRGVR